VNVGLNGEVRTALYLDRSEIERKATALEGNVDGL
jgi:hypothetical protein